MKRFLTLLLLFLTLPLQASAMTQVIYGPVGISTLNNSTRYYGFSAGTINNGGTISNLETPTSVSGTVSEVVFRLGAAPGAGQSHTVGLMINGVADADFGCAITDTMTSCSDTVNTATITEGQRITWRVVSSATAVNSDVYITAKFVPDADGESLVQGFTNGNISNSLTQYFPMTGSGGTTTPEHASTTMPTSGTMDKFYVRLSGSPGSGNAYIFTLFKNGVATNVDCTVSGTNTECSDTTDTASYNAGDSIYIRSEVSGTPTARIFKFGLRFRPTINGESLTFLRLTSFSNVARWEGLQGLGIRSTLESGAYASSTVTWVGRKLYFYDAFPVMLSAQSRSVTLRNAEASSALSATINSSSGTFVTDLNDEVTVTAGNLFNFQMDVTSNPPTSNTLWYVSMVSYVAPPAAAALPGQYRAYNLGSMLLNMGSLIFR